MDACAMLVACAAFSRILMAEWGPHDASLHNGVVVGNDNLVVIG